MGRERLRGQVIDVVFLADGPSEPPAQTLAELEQALRESGVDVEVSSVIGGEPTEQRARLAAAIGDGAAGSNPLAVLAADLVLNSPPLGALLDDPRIGTGALTVVEDGRLLHLSLLKIQGSDRAAAAAVLQLPQSGQDAPDLVLELIQGLDGAGTPVSPVPLGGYVWARPQTAKQAAQARAAVAAIPERTVRLREAARGGDGFYSTFVLRKLSWRLTGLAERLGLTPNQVTLISFGLGLLAAVLLATGNRAAMVAGAVLIQVCLVVDCVDGELARYRRRFSRFGAWLDASTDRVKEFALIGALAVAGSRGSESGRALYAIAAAAITVQTFRNLFDLGWSIQRSQAATVIGAPQEEAVRSPVPWDAYRLRLRLPPPRGAAGPGPLSWLRRLGHFPIGERFLLISVGAIFWTPRLTLVLLLTASWLATGYLVAAFVLRSRSSPAPAGALLGLADGGALLDALIGRLSAGRLPGLSASRRASVLPAAIAAGELVLTWWLAAEVGGAAGAGALTLVLCTAVAHYLHAYGVREYGALPQRAVLTGDLRLILLAATALVVGRIHPVSSGWAAVAVGVLAVLVAVTSTHRSLQRCSAARTVLVADGERTDTERTDTERTGGVPEPIAGPPR